MNPLTSMFEEIYLTRAILQERQREIHSLVLSRPNPWARARRRLLASLGALLHTWGRELEQQYGESPSSV